MGENMHKVQQWCCLEHEPVSNPDRASKLWQLLQCSNYLNSSSLPTTLNNSSEDTTTENIPANVSFADFLRTIVPNCQIDHWAPQSNAIPTPFLPYVNFVGHLETAAADVQNLLRRVDLWDEFGASGCGSDGTQAIFQSRGTVHHATHSASQDPLLLSSNDEDKELLDEICAPDYAFSLLTGPSTSP